MKIYVVTWCEYTGGGVVWCGTDLEKALLEYDKAEYRDEIEIWEDGECLGFVNIFQEWERLTGGS